MTAFCVAPSRVAILPIESPSALSSFKRLSRCGVQNGEETCLLTTAMGVQCEFYVRNVKRTVQLQGCIEYRKLL